jgi:hypothetical protein
LLGHPELENALNQLFLAIGGTVAEYPNEPNVDQAPERRLISSDLGDNVFVLRCEDALDFILIAEAGP